MAEKLVTEVNDANFHDEVINSDIPVVVDFWAPWCGPCKALTPILEDIAKEMEGQVKFTKMNTDENFTTSTDFKIMHLPTIAVFKKGQIVERHVGLAPRSVLVKKFAPHVGNEI